MLVRAYTSDIPWKRLPLPLRVVTHYGNAHPTPRSWRKDVLGLFRRMILQGAPIPPDLPVFGIESFDQLDAILAEFRELLHRVTLVDLRKHLAVSDLVTTIHRRSGLRVRNQRLDPKSRRLQSIYDTNNQSFTEMLYSSLVLSFHQVPIDCFRRCTACERFFFTPSGQRAKYCTGRCQIRTAMQTYRARKKARAANHTAGT